MKVTVVDFDSAWYINERVSEVYKHWLKRKKIPEIIKEGIHHENPHLGILISKQLKSYKVFGIDSKGQLTEALLSKAKNRQIHNNIDYLINKLEKDQCLWKTYKLK